MRTYGRMHEANSRRKFHIAFRKCHDFNRIIFILKQLDIYWSKNKNDSQLDLQRIYRKIEDVRWCSVHEYRCYPTPSGYNKIWSLRGNKLELNRPTLLAVAQMHWRYFLGLFWYTSEQNDGVLLDRWSGKNIVLT